MGIGLVSGLAEQGLVAAVGLLQGLTGGEEGINIIDEAAQGPQCRQVFEHGDEVVLVGAAQVIAACDDQEAVFEDEMGLVFQSEAPAAGLALAWSSATPSAALGAAAV